MKAGDLYVEDFPAVLKRDGKIAALREEITWREFVIRSVAARVAASAALEAGGQAPEAVPGSGPRVSKPS